MVFGHTSWCSIRLFDGDHLSVCRGDYQHPGGPKPGPALGPEKLMLFGFSTRISVSRIYANNGAKPFSKVGEGTGRWSTNHRLGIRCFCLKVREFPSLGISKLYPGKATADLRPCYQLSSFKQEAGLEIFWPTFLQLCNSRNSKVCVGFFRSEGKILDIANIQLEKFCL